MLSPNDTESKNKIMIRYGTGTSYPLKHHKDCLIKKCRICSCGLLHDLLHREDKETLYPDFPNELLFQRDAAEVLAETIC